MALARAHVLISGRVQGVCFRMYTQETAERLGLTGWVRNRWDGRVEAVFEGEEQDVAEAVRWCHRGSPYAHVTKVEVDWQEPTGKYDSFFITR